MGSEDSVHLDEALGVLGGLEPPEAPFALACGLTRVLRTVIQISMLPVRHAGHHHSFRSRVTARLVSDGYAWLATAIGAQPLAKESHGGEKVALGPDQNIDDDAVLIHSAPEVVSNTVDVQKALIQLPFVA